jgi:hypothetical protein
MIDDFVLAHANRAKKDQAILLQDGRQDNIAAQNLFGGDGEVFRKIGQGIPSINDESELDFNLKDIACVVENNFLYFINVENYNEQGGYRWKYGYPLKFTNGANREELPGLNIPKSVNYYSVDLPYLNAVARAFDTENFNRFAGEGKKILEILTHLYSFGSIDNGKIYVASTMNEYGKEPTAREFKRNVYIDKIHNKFGYNFATSNDADFALTPDDYSKLAALDYALTYMATGMPIIVDQNSDFDIFKDIGYTNNDSYGKKTIVTAIDYNEKYTEFYKRIAECI